MEVKKTPKANLENRRTLYGEIGLVVALLIVWGAFSMGSSEKKTSILQDDTQIVEVEDMVPITQETPPPPPEEDLRTFHVPCGSRYPSASDPSSE